MQGKVDTPHRELAAIAERQHGVVGVRQLLALGFGSGAVEHMVRCHRLHRVFRGVYAVGHSAISLNGRFMAAVLACGRGALLSYRSAGQLWGLGFDYWKIEVTARGGPAGIAIHQTSHPAGYDPRWHPGNQRGADSGRPGSGGQRRPPGACVRRR
jgi:hypothetical protein